jgi:hypothetical protein
MANRSVPKSRLVRSRLGRAVESGEDPIAMIQKRIMHAHALCKIIAESSESVSTGELDLMTALFGLAELLDETWSDLDPREFRALVLADEDKMGPRWSPPEEVAHAKES